MALQIVQQPLWTVTGFSPADSQFFRIPVGQQIIFAVADATIVATKYKVKFVAEVHVSSGVINISTNNDRIGTFKTTPNNEGVGIFDLRPVLETFVKADNDSSVGSSYKLEQQRGLDFPIHLIDRFAMATNGVKLLAIKFYIEYSDDPNGEVVTTEDTNYTTSPTWVIFNGVLQPDDSLQQGLNNIKADFKKRKLWI